MKFVLKEVCKIKYSKGERKIFRLLSRDRKSSTRLMCDHYRPEAPPYNGRKIVVGLLASLGRKLDYNKEPFQLASSPRSGPHAIDFWLEKRK